jgi:hypothetical protein
MNQAAAPRASRPRLFRQVFTVQRLDRAARRVVHDGLRQENVAPPEQRPTARASFRTP